MKLMGYLLVMLLAVHPTARASGGASLDVHVVATLSPEDVAAVSWARFSPEDPTVVLAESGSGAYLVYPDEDKTTKIGLPGHPAGWLGGGILWRSDRGTYTVLVPRTVRPEASLSALTRFPLPWTLTSGEDLEFMLRLDSQDISDIPAMSPEGRTDRRIVAHLVPPRFSVGGPDSRAILDAERRVLKEFPLRIYGFEVSADGYKLMISFGERHIVWNSLTGSIIDLPTGVSAWRWFPDGSTLVGSEGEIPTPAQEIIIRTRLAVFDTTSWALRAIRLPKPYDDAVLDLLDISSQGFLLIRAHRTLPKAENLGWVLIAPVWN